MKTLKVNIEFEIEADPSDTEQVNQEIQFKLQEYLDADDLSDLNGISIDAEGDEDED